MRLLHLHIPKCAGGSLLLMLKSQYGTRRVQALAPRHDWKRLTPSIKYTKLVVSGHYPFGLHAQIDDPDPIYITFLREPLDRIGSLYAYIKMRDRAHAAYGLISQMTAQEFAESGPFNNCQVRMLSGREDFGWYDDKARLTAEDFKRAKDNLVQQMVFVGDVSHFQEDVTEIGAMLGWETMAVPRANASLSTPRIEPTVKVRERWYWDLRLWDWWRVYRAAIRQEARAKWHAYKAEWAEQEAKLCGGG